MLDGGASIRRSVLRPFAKLDNIDTKMTNTVSSKSIGMLLAVRRGCREKIWTYDGTGLEVE